MLATRWKSQSGVVAQAAVWSARELARREPEPVPEPKQSTQATCSSATMLRKIISHQLPTFFRNPKVILLLIIWYFWQNRRLELFGRFFFLFGWIHRLAAGCHEPRGYEDD